MSDQDEATEQRHKFGRCTEDLGAGRCSDGRWTETSSYCWKHHLPYEVADLRAKFAEAEAECGLWKDRAAEEARRNLANGIARTKAEAERDGFRGELELLHERTSADLDAQRALVTQLTEALKASARQHHYDLARDANSACRGTFGKCRGPSCVDAKVALGVAKEAQHEKA